MAALDRDRRATRTTKTTSLDELVAALIESWNDRDARLFGSLFREGADYVTGQGSSIKGPNAIADLLVSGKAEKVILNGGPSIRVDGDAASVVFSWRSGSSARRGVITFAASRHDDGWYIDRLRNTDAA